MKSALPRIENARVSMSLIITPPHLAGHCGVTHLDCGSLRWLVGEFHIRSMLDIGCGPGGMRQVAAAANVRWMGIDGDPQCAANDIMIHDFSQGACVVEAFDLAWSVEFLEHVEERYVPHFMDCFQRAKHACITHALPGKPGHHHVNCQPSGYWKELFRAYGFCYDELGTMWMRKRSTMKREFMRQTGMLFHRIK